MTARARRLLIAAATAVSLQGALAYAVFSSYYPVRPQLMCVRVVAEDAAIAFFGWANEEDDVVREVIGDDNRFLGGRADRGQPQAFPAGSSGGYPRGGFSVPFSGSAVTWRLGTREVTATRDSPACPEPATFRELKNVALVLPRPAPPEVPKVVEPPPKPPEPKATEEVAATPDAKKEPTREAKNHIKKRGQPKPKKRPKPVETVVDEPPPLVLSGLTTLSKGVGVQAGEVDILGDSRVAATASNSNVVQVTAPDRIPKAVGDGTGGVRGPKRVAPKVRKRVKGVYPDDAPQLGRVVLVKLSLLVGVDGTVARVRVIKGAGAAFDREARAVGSRLVFAPGTVDGVATEQWVPWVVEFAPENW